MSLAIKSNGGSIAVWRALSKAAFLLALGRVLVQPTPLGFELEDALTLHDDKEHDQDLALRLIVQQIYHLMIKHRKGDLK